MKCAGHTNTHAHTQTYTDTRADNTDRISARTVAPKIMHYYCDNMHVNILYGFGHIIRIELQYAIEIAKEMRI